MRDDWPQTVALKRFLGSNGRPRRERPSRARAEEGAQRTCCNLATSYPLTRLCCRRLYALCSPQVTDLVRKAYLLLLDKVNGIWVPC